MENQGNEIFNIEANREGIGWLLRICRILNWIIIFSLTAGAISVVHNILSLIDFDPRLFNQKPWLKYEYAAHPYFWVVYDILWFLQVFLFIGFRKGIKKSVEQSDSKEFNSAFEYLYKNLRLAVITILMAVIANAYNLFLHVHYH